MTTWLRAEERSAADLNEEGEHDNDANGVGQLALHWANAEDDAHDCTAHLQKEQPPESATHAD